MRVRRESFSDPTEVTLTYPKEWREWCPSGKAAKLHLRQFAWRWEHRYGFPVWVWKLEFQARGAPHFMILVDRPKDPDFDSWVHSAWSEVVTAGTDAVHRHHGVHIASVKSWEAFVGRYFSGYLTKGKGHQDEPPENFNPGRWWMVSPALLEPWLISGELSRSATKLVVRQVRKAVVRKLGGRRSRRPSRALWTAGRAEETAGPLIYWAQSEEQDSVRASSSVESRSVR